jgi:hypothetical protein
MKDPIQAEIHKYREEHARKFNFDLTAISKDLRERSDSLKVIRLPPKKMISRRGRIRCVHSIPYAMLSAKQE